MSSLLDLLLLIFTLFPLSLASPLAQRSAQAFVYPGDAPFTVPAATLAAALTCPYGKPTAARPPVLLVHGTATTGNLTWGMGYVPALQAYNYTACYVTLPNRAMGDMQVSSEYVAYALHMMQYLSGGIQTAVISHSQGGPDTQWALRFWPSTRSSTRAFIALSPDFAGIDLLGSELSDVCVDDLCEACLWQQSAGSHYYAALHADNFTSEVPTTAIWTAFDGVVNPPQSNAQLPGATVLSVQDLCPYRFVTHLSITNDAAAFALALDALGHGGVASLARCQVHAWTTCLTWTAPHMSSSITASLTSAYDDLVDGFVLGKKVAVEPPVMAYALPPN